MISLWKFVFLCFREISLIATFYVYFLMPLFWLNSIMAISFGCFLLLCSKAIQSLPYKFVISYVFIFDKIKILAYPLLISYCCVSNTLQYIPYPFSIWFYFASNQRDILWLLHTALFSKQLNRCHIPTFFFIAVHMRQFNNYHFAWLFYIVFFLTQFNLCHILFLFFIAVFSRQFNHHHFIPFFRLAFFSYSALAIPLTCLILLSFRNNLTIVISIVISYFLIWYCFVFDNIQSLPFLIIFRWRVFQTIPSFLYCLVISYYCVLEGI